MMSNLRANLPKSLGGIAVVEVRDYENSVAIDIATGTKKVIDLPKSDVLQFITVDGDVISARPSGTEPKIKFYCSVKAPLTAKSHYEQLQKELATKVDRMMADII
ncbi:Phosphoglucomutase [compost metagenome]